MAKRVLMKGNEVIAEAAIRAGCRHYFGYPITPQTEVMHYMAREMVKHGGTFVQAESIKGLYWCTWAQSKAITGTLRGEVTVWFLPSSWPAAPQSAQFLSP